MLEANNVAVLMLKTTGPCQWRGLNIPIVIMHEIPHNW